MNRIFFPARYKKVLKNKKKNITIRYGNEFGKYKKGRIYHAFSYVGRDMDLKIKIINITRKNINELDKIRIHANTIKKLKKECKGLVEVINFKVI